MRLLLPLAAVACCCLTGFAAEPTANVKKFLGDKTIEILDGATKVEVYRISPNTKPGSNTIGEYPIIGRGKDQDKAFAAKLRTILFDESTYNFESAKACEFSPGVALRVFKGEEYADVFLCFSCKELRIQQGKHVNQEDFDNKYSELVKLAKTALPDDKEIQALAEKK
jgi:hypothetical protein